MEDVRKRVIGTLAKSAGKPEEEVRPESRFKEDLEMDSLDSVEAVMELEEEFGIELPADVAAEVTTVEKAIELIESELAKK